MSKLQVRKANFETLSESELKKLMKLTIQGSGLKCIYQEYKKLKRYDVSKEKINEFNFKFLIKGKKSISAWSGYCKDDYFRSAKHTALVYVFIHKNQRKKGLATKMFKKAVIEAQKKGFQKIAVYPHDSKSEAFFNRPQIKEYVIQRGLKFAKR